MSDYLNEDILGFGESKVKMTVTYDQIDYLTKLGLLQAIEAIESAGPMIDQEMVDAYDGINQALAWFTTPQEQEALTARPIPADFLEAMANWKKGD